MLQKLHNFICSRRALLLCAIGFIVPFFIFSFWNHLSVDDYFIGIKKQKEDFWSVQYFYYTRWHGRYISILSTSILVFSNLLYSKTEFIGIYFLTATVLAFYYLLFQINRYILKHLISRLSLFVSALVLLIAELNFIPQPVSAFYWFSGAVTYQQPLIFLFLLAGSVTGLFFSRAYKKLYFTATLFLLICMQGYNEMLTIWFLLYSTFLALFYMYRNQNNKHLIIFLMACNYITAIILLSAPGNFHRAAFFDTSPALLILGISASKFLILNWFFLKEPLWWFLLLILISNNRLKQILSAHYFFLQLQSIKCIHLILIYIAFGVLTYFPILYISNGSIPYRMENAICFLHSLTLIAILVLKSPIAGVSNAGSLLYKYRFLLISFGIFLTPNMEKVSQTMLSGFFYDKVMEERLSILRNASLQQQSEIYLDDYHTAVKRMLTNQFPNGTRKTFEDIMTQKPSLLFFTDDLMYRDNIILLQDFYNIDTIKVNRRQRD